jgi:hypothetical protein
MIGAPLTADAFYAQRDQRASVELPLHALSRRRIAIAVPASAAGSIGLELALWWAASIIRRMGKAFAETIIIASDSFRRSPSHLSSGGDQTVEQVVTAEMQQADPFARVEWRAPDAGVPPPDAARLLWLGQPPPALADNSAISVNAHGWIALVQAGAEDEFALTPPGIDFDASPSAIVMAVCLAAGRIFSDAFETRTWPKSVAVALDTGSVSQDPDTCRTWLSYGRTRTDGAPWRVEQGPVPTLQKLLLVSAGGIGGNVARLLSQSHVRASHARVLDDDVFDISNLNRAVGLGVAAVGTPKATAAAEALSSCCDDVVGIQVSYERWRTEELLREFRVPGTAIVIGVDQVRSRLEVGSDWPWLLVNGATSGSSFSCGVHFSGDGGCIGCWYGSDHASYQANRTPMACAAGVAPGTIEFRPAASYPFVSVAASATLASMLINAAHDPGDWQDAAGTIRSMSVRTPEAAQCRRIPINKRCLLLCAEDYLQRVLGRITREFVQ